jgi:anti-sigma factor RsiW
MKDTKFIELLNLYLDQQIEPDDAARLEEEIARNPRRRETYRQYCRMHRACTMLFEQSHPSSEVGVKLASSAAAVEEKIEAFPAPVRSRAWIGYAAGLAAAACVALVFVQRTTNDPRPSSDVAVQMTPAKATVPVPSAVRESVLMAQSTQLAPSAARSVGRVGDAPSLDWMRQVNFAPVAHVPAAELAFEPHPSIQPENDQQVFQSRLPFQGKVEKAAFQFQR